MALDTIPLDLPDVTTLTGGESWSDNVTAGAPFLWLGT